MIYIYPDRTIAKGERYYKIRAVVTDPKNPKGILPTFGSPDFPSSDPFAKELVQGAKN